MLIEFKPHRKEVNPGTATPAAYCPGTVPKEGSCAEGFPAGKVWPVRATTRLTPNLNELSFCVLKVCASLAAKNWRRESYPVRLLFSSSGCRAVPLSYM